jgi:hypothetical protein
MLYPYFDPRQPMKSITIVIIFFWAQTLKTCLNNRNHHIKKTRNTN